MTTDTTFAYRTNIKQMLEPAILSYLANYNKNSIKNSVVAVITGGSALERMFTDEVFATDDFDIKFTYLDAPENPNAWTNEKYQFLERQRGIFGRGLEVFINDAVVSSGNQFSDLVRHLLKSDGKYFTYKGTRTGILYTLSYAYTDDNAYVYDSSLCDVVLHTPKTHFSYGVTPVPLDPTTEYANRDVIGVKSRRGFVNAIMKEGTISEIEPYVFYTSLGYCIWDTVRMLNWSIDAILDPPSRSVHLKLDRYIKKYRRILDALSDPQGKLKCLPIFEQYCLSCGVANFKEELEKTKMQLTHARNLNQTYQTHIQNMQNVISQASNELSLKTRQINEREQQLSNTQRELQNTRRQLQQSQTLTTQPSNLQASMINLQQENQRLRDLVRRMSEALPMEIDQ
jgi:hypothetical protein